MLQLLDAKRLVLTLTCINFCLPTIVIASVLYLQCQFSGVPRREEFKSRLKMIQWAVSVWSVTRLVRAISSIWDIEMLFGMMLELNDKESLDAQISKNGLEMENSKVLIVPMLLIVIFLVVEIWPIWVVLDGNFVDIFLKYQVLIEEKDLRIPLLNNNQSVTEQVQRVNAIQQEYSQQHSFSMASSYKQSDYNLFSGMGNQFSSNLDARSQLHSARGHAMSINDNSVDMSQLIEMSQYP